MILECPSCQARYLAPAGLFATGGRQVRCARCKHEWFATLPTHINVFVAPEPVTEPAPGAALATGPQTPIAATPNLPALVKNDKLQKILLYIAAGFLTLMALLAWPVLDRNAIVKKYPDLRDFYESVGLHVAHAGTGLLFEQVKSELRYDGGTMKLFVDGIIHNATEDMQFIPNIKARALDPGRHIIQSWWVDPPAATVEPGADVPFHTEINAAMQQTIEDVYLEFYTREEKDNVRQ